MKKYICLISLISVLFVIYLIIYFLPRDYEIVYNVDNFNIKESYNKEYNYYFYEISNKEYTFEYSFYGDYNTKRKKISEVKIYEKDDLYCIIPKINKEDDYPICNNNGEFTDIYLIDDEEINKYKNVLSDVEVNYNKININNYYNSTFAVWNYKGLYLLEENNNSDVKIFLKDVYIDELSILVDNILFVPNYNTQYSFNEVYLINMIDGEVEQFELGYDISYDSYILGEKDSNLYLVDKKNKTEYKINVTKKKIEIIGTEEKDGLIFDSKWKDISLNKLCAEDYSFSNENIYNYYIEDSKLLMKYKDGNIKVLINDSSDMELLSISKGTVLYLINDSLYAYNTKYGNKLLMTYFEWNFNYYNKVFIYNQF